jgi:uncharacterized protein YndB with AHSA1/START domain
MPLIAYTMDLEKMSLPSNILPGTAIAAASSHAQVEIAASPQRVWSLLSNIDEWPQWNKLVQKAVLRGPLQPDSVFTWKSNGLTVISTLREVTPPQRITWTGKAFGTRAIHTWAIEETDHGVVLRTAESFDGWLPQLMPKAMQRMLDESLTAWLASIKAEAERNIPQTSRLGAGKI